MNPLIAAATVIAAGLAVLGPELVKVLLQDKL
jgi:hypothetical protein